MVSKGLRQLKNMKAVNGGVFNPSVTAANYAKEQDQRKAEIAARTKAASRDTRKRNEAAIEANDFKIGDRVTDGRVSGKIRSFDQKTKTALVFTGRREIPISPTVLRLA